MADVAIAFEWVVIVVSGIMKTWISNQRYFSLKQFTDYIRPNKPSEFHGDPDISEFKNYIFFTTEFVLLFQLSIPEVFIKLIRSNYLFTFKGNPL